MPKYPACILQAMDAGEAREMLQALRARPDLVVQVVPNPFKLAWDATIQDIIKQGTLGSLDYINVRQNLPLSHPFPPVGIIIISVAPLQLHLPYAIDCLAAMADTATAFCMSFVSNMTHREQRRRKWWMLVAWWLWLTWPWPRQHDCSGAGLQIARHLTSCSSGRKVMCKISDEHLAPLYLPLFSGDIKCGHKSLYESGQMLAVCTHYIKINTQDTVQAR